MATQSGYSLTEMLNVLYRYKVIERREYERIFRRIQNRYLRQ